MLITILAVLLAFAGIILMVVPIIVDQVTQLVTRSPKLLEPADAWWDDVEAWVNSIFPNLGSSTRSSSRRRTGAIENVGAITGGVIGAGIALVLRARAARSSC